MPKGLPGDAGTLIASGGFGAVYRAYQETVGREVAVKVILPKLANNPDFIRRFEIEAQTIARLEHMHIAPLHEALGYYLGHNVTLPQQGCRC